MAARPPPGPKEAAAAAAAQPPPPEPWRPSGRGLVLQHAWLAHALRLVASRGFAVLPAPVLAPSSQSAAASSERHTKLSRLCKERGETSAPKVGGADAIGALHACSSLQPKELPLRYALVVPAAAAAAIAAEAEVEAARKVVVEGGCQAAAWRQRLHRSGRRGYAAEVWLSVACADGGSCWRCSTSERPRGGAPRGGAATRGG